MLIDVPVTLVFDCTDIGDRSRKLTKVITMRMDLDDTDAPIEVLDEFPPKDTDASWPESEGVLCNSMSSEIYRAIEKKARRNPYEYLVGTDAEREVAQKIADEEARDQPQGF